ncbi:hypothetical protein N566_25395 [Streptomycetaceae bacterium MP113-05]|nr:hypothetical protein N566_25395 [Streptomycetaceae bacterium MP113-05]
MPDTRARPPEGRYGRSGAEATGGGSDRGLRSAGVVLGVVLLALVGWFGYSYVAGTEVSGSVVTFRKISDESVEVKLEVHKDADVTGVCTLRVLGSEGGVVGRKDVRIGSGAERVDPVVTVRTTGPAARLQLAGCHVATGG